MSFVLVVRMKAKEGEEARALELMGELAEATRHEGGCEASVPWGFERMDAFVRAL